MTDKALKQANDIAVGVDVTKEGTHVVAMRLRTDGVNEVVYSQFHSIAQPQEKYTYGTPLLDAMVGCPPCNNHCNQGRTCPSRQTRKTTREEKITNPGVYSTSQMAKDGFVEANIKRTQMLKEAMDNEHKYMNYRAAFPKEYDGKSLMRMQDRNETLEEVAREFEKMPFGDTGASICAYIRGMKT